MIFSKHSSSKPARRGRIRSRYDHQWWGESPPSEQQSGRYWAITQRPFTCLVFVFPLLLLYEFGVDQLGASDLNQFRAGIDSWLRYGLATCGLRDRWLLPLLVTLLLLGWQAMNRSDWRVHPLILGGMWLESVCFAALLVGLSKVVDLGFSTLDGLPGLDQPRLQVGQDMSLLVGFIGAGIYEETIFRLVLIPLLYWGLKLLTIPALLACTLAITGSSLLFSLAHHAGTPGEPFELFNFVFRWLAGVYFSYIFVSRGFGVAVGTHTVYDLLIGWCQIRN